MAQVGSLSIDLIAQTASFNANITKAAQNLNSQSAMMQKSLQRIEAGVVSTSAAVKAMAGAFLAGETLRIGSAALDYAASLGEVSQQIGVTVRDLQVYRYAATQVGLSNEETEKALGKLTQTLGKAQLGSKDSAAVFSALGVSIRGAKGELLSASDVLPQLADAIGSIKDPAERAAIEVALFGRAGQKLDTLLSGGNKSIQEMAEQASQLGLVLDDKLAASADEAADKIAEMKMQLEVNISRVVAENAQSIVGLANSISDLTEKSIKLAAEYPRLTAVLGGAAVGSRFGGLPGAAVGGGLGLIGSLHTARAAADKNMNVGFRRARLTAANEQMDRLWNNGNRGKPLEDAAAEVQRQVALLNQARRARTQPGSESPAASAADIVANSGLNIGGMMAPSGSSAKLKGEAEKYTEELKKQTDQLKTQTLEWQQQLQLAALRNQGAQFEADLLEAEYDVRSQFPKLERETTAEYAKRIAGALDVRKQIAALDAGAGIMNSPLELPDDAQHRIENDWKSLTEKARGFGGDVKVAWADAADGVIYSLDRITSAVRGGGVLEALSGVLNLALSLGSLGLFGKGVQANLNQSVIAGARANGGHVNAGSTYLVGENGPELFTAGQTGFIHANDAFSRVRGAITSANDNARGGRPLFDLRGAVMTADLVAQMNAVGEVSTMRGAAGGTAGAVRQQQRASRWRIP